MKKIIGINYSEFRAAYLYYTVVPPVLAFRPQNFIAMGFWKRMWLLFFFAYLSRFHNLAARSRSLYTINHKSLITWDLCVRERVLNKLTRNVVKFYNNKSTHLHQLIDDGERLFTMNFRCWRDRVVEKEKEKERWHTCT